MNHDTKALLLECGAGVQMALGAIDDVLGQTRDKALEQALLTCRETHRALEKQTKTLLAAEHIPEKSANAMARGMSWLKTSTSFFASPCSRTCNLHDFLALVQKIFDCDFPPRGV